MNINKNEYLALKHLSEDKEPDKAPVGLTDAQYATALKSLKAKGMVLAEFEEGGGMVDAKIRLSGQAVLDDYKDEEEHIIRTLIAKTMLTVNQNPSGKQEDLVQKPLTMQQYTLLKIARDKGCATNIFEVSKDTYKQEIWAPLTRNKYLTIDHNISALVITPLGKDLLETMEKELAYELTAKQAANANIADMDTGDTCKLKINAAHRKQFAKGILMANELGHFTDENGNPCQSEQVIDAFAEFFGDEEIKDYSSLLDENGNLQDKELIEELTKVFYSNTDIFTIVDFIEKIRSTNNNTEKARIAADFVKTKNISDLSCKTDLWEVIKHHGLYKPKCNNWIKAINQFLPSKKVK